MSSGMPSRLSSTATRWSSWLAGRANYVGIEAPRERGDAGPPPLDGDPLELLARGRDDLVEHRADAALAHALPQRVGHLPARGVDLDELADLLRERHAGEQLVRASLDVALRGRGGGAQAKGGSRTAGARH